MTPQELQPMAYGLIHAWLAKDYWTIARIMDAIGKSDADKLQVAEVISLAAAAVLADALGGSSAAAAKVAAARAGDDVARQARMITG